MRHHFGLTLASLVGVADLAVVYIDVIDESWDAVESVRRDFFREDGLLNYYKSMQQEHVGIPGGAGKGEGRREGKGKVKCKGKEGNKNTRMPAYVDTCLTECAAPPTRQDPGISCED